MFRLGWPVRGVWGLRRCVPNGHVQEIEKHLVAPCSRFHKLLVRVCERDENPTIVPFVLQQFNDAIGRFDYLVKRVGILGGPVDRRVFDGDVERPGSVNSPLITLRSRSVKVFPVVLSTWGTSLSNHSSII